MFFIYVSQRPSSRCWTTNTTIITDYASVVFHLFVVRWNIWGKKIEGFGMKIFKKNTIRWWKKDDEWNKKMKNEKWKDSKMLAKEPKLDWTMNKVPSTRTFILFLADSLLISKQQTTLEHVLTVSWHQNVLCVSGAITSILVEMKLYNSSTFPVNT